MSILSNLLVSPKPSEAPPRERPQRERRPRPKADLEKAESRERRRPNLILAGIAAGFGTWIASLIILAIIGVRANGASPLAPAMALASTAALAVFGGFLIKFYLTRTGKPVPASNPVKQQCLILAAPTHGVLQDRANYWLSGKYGKVISSTMSATEKGFYMAIFYESVEIKALEEKKEVE